MQLGAMSASSADDAESISEDDVESISALGFSVQEARLALDHVTARFVCSQNDPHGGLRERAARLLLTLLSPSFDDARVRLLSSGDGLSRRDASARQHIDEYVISALDESEGVTALDTEAEAALQDELVALESIFGDGFAVKRFGDGGAAAGAEDGEMRLGRVCSIRLQLRDLQPLPGELHLRLPCSGRYPHTPLLPVFAPYDSARLPPPIRRALARQLAERARSLSADGSPAVYELSSWLETALPSLLDEPHSPTEASRLPPLLEPPEALRERQRRATIAADHLGAAWTATLGLARDEAEAEAKGVSLDEYLRQAGQSSACRRDLL
jgi:hypothetical protein